MKVKLKNPAGFLASNGVHYRDSSTKRDMIVDMPDSLFKEVEACRNCEIVEAPRHATAEDAVEQTAGKKARVKTEDEAKSALDSVLNGK